LEPPADGRPESVGLTDGEANMIRTTNPYDQNGLYLRADVRAGQNKRTFRLFVDAGRNDVFREVTYSSLNPDYSDPGIQPAIDPSALPDVSKGIAAIDVGHQASASSFPINFVMTGDSYTRINGDPPQTVGSSLRYALH